MRKMVSSDYNEVCQLDGTQTVKKLKETLNAKSDSEGFVIELNKSIIGYVIYEPAYSFIVTRIFIDPIYRKMGYGRRLLNNLIDIMIMEEVKCMLCMVDEYNVDTQLFLKSMGFVATTNKTNRSMLDFKYCVEEMAIV
jgi:ribosomal protein S18 acetylase RimI-like enzyme